MINRGKYPNAFGGWEKIVTIIEEEDAFNNELFLDTFLESFEVLKPYFKEDMLPKDAAQLLCEIEVFARHDTFPNAGLDKCRMAQGLAQFLSAKVFDSWDYAFALNKEYGVDVDDLTDEQCVVIDGGAAWVMEVGQLRQYYLDRTIRKMQEARLEETAQDEVEILLTDEEAAQLFTYLEEALDKEPCDNTFKHTIEWVRSNLGEDRIEEVLRSLESMGGFCDCEVLWNCTVYYDIEDDE